MRMGDDQCEPCTCLQELGEDCFQTSSLDIPPWLQSNGNPTPAKSCVSEPQMDGSQTCECGRGMSACSIHPSTPNEWIASMRDSLAKTLALLESKQELLKEPDRGFTEKSCVLLGLLDPDTSSWRMWPLLPRRVLTKWSKTWPKWGMTCDGVAYAHPMWERRISGTDGGAWLPTPTATDWKRTPQKRTYAMRPITIGAPDDLAKFAVRESGIAHARLEPSLWEWAMGIPVRFTKSKDWVTHKSRSKRQQHSKSSQKDGLIDENCV